MSTFKIYIAKAITYMALALGAFSLLWFGLFLYAGAFSVLDFGLGLSGALWVNAGLSGLFFAQHSIMVRKGFRTRMLTVMPEPYYGAFYGITSAFTLLVVLIGWQETSYMVFSAEGVYRVPFRLLFLAALAGFAWGALSLQSFDSSGAKNLQRYTENRPREAIPLTIQGPYRFVRHPMYFISLLMIWSCPDISADKLLFNVLWSAWIVAGAMLEERDLVDNFGDAYRDYQRSVPMLIPWKIWNRRHNGSDD